MVPACVAYSKMGSYLCKMGFYLWGVTERGEGGGCWSSSLGCYPPPPCVYPLLRRYMLTSIYTRICV